MTDKRIQSFKTICYELTVTHDGLLLRNTRLVIPEALQKEAFMIAHEGHQGMTKTKRLIRSKVWFPNMDTLIESIIRSCHECVINTPSKNCEPLKMSKLPDGPWLDVSMDLWTTTYR